MSFFGYSWAESTPKEETLVGGSTIPASQELDKEQTILQSFESVEVSADDLPGKQEAAVAATVISVEQSAPKESRTDEHVKEEVVTEKPGEFPVPDEDNSATDKFSEMAVREKIEPTAKTPPVKKLETSDESVDKHDVLEKPTEDTSLFDAEHGSIPASSEPSEQPEAEIDLDFVEQYDNAFNEFIMQNTGVLLANPDLVHNLRITKLQALLQYADETETEWLQRLEGVKQSKAEMEISYQQQLRDASRKKAARDIHLRSKLVELNKETKMMEGKLMWQLISSSEAAVKNHQRLIEELKNKPQATNRQELLDLLPEGPSFQAIRDAAGAPPLSDSEESPPLTQEQEEKLKQTKIDNAFLNGEIAILQKKLEYQKAAAMKLGWVESVLMRMDQKSMKKLKSRYKKKMNARLS